MKRLLAAAAVLVLVAAAVWMLGPAVRSGSDSTEVPAHVAGSRFDPQKADDPNQQGVAPAANSTTSGRARVLDPGAPRSLNQIVESSRTFNEAIANARTAFGEADPRVAELLDMAEIVCSQPPDPTDATNPKHPDPTRRWAVERLMTLCEGFDPKQPTVKFSAPPSLAQVLKSQGKDAAASEANRRLRTANDYDTLVEAGQLLLETGALPLDSILPGHRERYGPADLVPAWAIASQLVGCSGTSACGPDSLPTALFCASVGCVEGVTYEQALTQELSPSQLRAVMAFRQWIVAQRQAQN